MLSPWLSRKNVCPPNKSLSCGITGWSSGMASPRNWVRVRSTCADVNFIAHSFQLSLCRLGLPSMLPEIAQAGSKPGNVARRRCGGEEEGRENADQWVGRLLLRARRERPGDGDAPMDALQFAPSDGDCHTPLPSEVRNAEIPRHERAVL